MTGVTVLTRTLTAKRLELLHEIVPAARTIGFLVKRGWRPPMATA